MKSDRYTHPLLGEVVVIRYYPYNEALVSCVATGGFSRVKTATLERLKDGDTSNGR